MIFIGANARAPEKRCRRKGTRTYFIIFYSTTQLLSAISMNNVRGTRVFFYSIASCREMTNTTRARLRNIVETTEK